MRIVAPYFPVRFFRAAAVYAVRNGVPPSVFLPDNAQHDRSLMDTNPYFNRPAVAKLFIKVFKLPSTFPQRT